MTTRRGPAKKAKPSLSPAPPSLDAFNPVRQAMWSRPGFLVRRLHQINDALFFEECQTNNITPVQFGILTALSMNPWLDQKAIGRELALDRTTIAEVLKRLVNKGLVERRINPDDRRSRLSVITKQGLSLMRTLQDGMWRSQQRFLGALSPKDRATFMKLVGQIVLEHEQMDRSN